MRHVEDKGGVSLGPLGVECLFLPSSFITCSFTLPGMGLKVVDGDLHALTNGGRDEQFRVKEAKKY